MPSPPGRDQLIGFRNEPVLDGVAISRVRQRLRVQVGVKPGALPIELRDHGEVPTRFELATSCAISPYPVDPPRRQCSMWSDSVDVSHGASSFGLPGHGTPRRTRTFTGPWPLQWL